KILDSVARACCLFLFLLALDLVRDDPGQTERHDSGRQDRRRTKTHPHKCALPCCRNGRKIPQGDLQRSSKTRLQLLCPPSVAKTRRAPEARTTVLASGARCVLASGGRTPRSPRQTRLVSVLVIVAHEAGEPAIVLALLAAWPGRARAGRRALRRARLAHRHLPAYLLLHAVRLIGADRARHLDTLLLGDPAAGRVTDPSSPPPPESH